MSLAAAKDVREDAAVVAVSSELDGFFTLKEKQRSALKAVLGGSTVAHRGSPSGGNADVVSSLNTNRKPQTVAKWFN